MTTQPQWFPVDDATADLLHLVADEVAGLGGRFTAFGVHALDEGRVVFEPFEVAVA